MKRVLTIALVMLPTIPVAVADAPRLRVEDVRALLISAIDSPTGQAQGLLIGPVAQRITEHFKATSPILIDVTTERRYRQPGCSRLKLTFSQDGVNLPGAPAPERRTVDIGLNYCRDGTPPKSLL